MGYLFANNANTKIWPVTNHIIQMSNILAFQAEIKNDIQDIVICRIERQEAQLLQQDTLVSGPTASLSAKCNPKKET